MSWPYCCPPHNMLKYQKIGGVYMKRLSLSCVLLFVFLLPPCHSFAGEATTVGGPCTTGLHRADWDALFQCVGSVWKRAAIWLGASSDACDSSHAGQIQWTGTAFQKCDGSGSWKDLGGGDANYYGLQNLTMVPYGKTVKSSTLQYTAKGSSTVSITSPAQISINGGAWTSSGTISTGQSLQLQITAPMADNATLSVNLTTGTKVDPWTITTAPSTWAQGGNSYNGYNIFSRWCRVGQSCSSGWCYYNCDGNGIVGCTMAAAVTTYAGSISIVDSQSPGSSGSYTTNTSSNAYVHVAVCPGTLSPPNPSGLLMTTPPYTRCNASDAGNVDSGCTIVY